MQQVECMTVEQFIVTIAGGLLKIFPIKIQTVSNYCFVFFLCPTEGKLPKNCLFSVTEIPP